MSYATRVYVCQSHNGLRSNRTSDIDWKHPFRACFLGLRNTASGRFTHQAEMPSIRPIREELVEERLNVASSWVLTVTRAEMPQDNSL